MLARILMKAFEFGWGADKHRRPQRRKYRNLVYLIIDHKIHCFPLDRLAGKYAQRDSVP